MKQELLKRYVGIEKRYKELEAEREAIRLEILEDMQKNDTIKAETDFGSFSVCEKTVWAYSPAVKKLEDKVKIEKDKEQKKGKAKPSITSYLKFTKAHDEI